MNWLRYKAIYLAYYSHKSSTVSMFLLKDHANQMWVKEYIIELHEVYNNVGNDTLLRIMGYLPSGEVLFTANGMKTFLYDMKKRGFREIVERQTWMGWCKNLYFDRFFALGKR